MMKAMLVNRMTMRSLTAAVGLALVGCPGPEQTLRETVNLSIPLNADGALTVFNVVGTVEIKAADTAAGTVTITAEKVARFSAFDATRAQSLFDAIEIRPTGEGAEARVESVFPTGLNARVQLSVEFVIDVPPGASVIADNVVGTLTIQGVMGDIKGNVEVGKITVQEPASTVNLEVAVGDIEIVHGAALNADEIINASVQTGAIELSLPADSAFDFTGDVSVGGIDATAFTGINTNRNVTGESADGAANGGGARVDLRVEVGSIDLIAL